MHGIDESLTFKPLNIAVFTISDTRTSEDDKSGDTLEKMVTEAGHRCAERLIIKDHIDRIRDAVISHMDNGKTDVIITTGGTGLTGRDVTIEAVTPLFDKKIDGFSALMHMLSYKTVGTSTIASRASAGLCSGTLLFALPGSPGACKDAWNGILKYQLDSRHKPCNLVSLMPRFKEV